MCLFTRTPGVNTIDWLFRNGFGKDMFHHVLPLIPGCDVAGVVEQIGSGVRRFKIGDLVNGYLDLQRNGAIVEYSLVKESELVVTCKSKRDYRDKAVV
jgi:NADPH:quinone reductase-like Zn-dependent oxidoreductase